ncbi:hypothetical protein [Vibrio gallicus]|uniref:hypothetical protein n=1 Tax=Vibrio gallicus TaxID=190897 RepID=UPI0036F1CC65
MVFGYVSYVGNLTGELLLFKKFIYTFHMPIFLILSGYFLKLNLSLKSQLYKIFSRMIVPYFIFLGYTYLV